MRMSNSMSAALLASIAIAASLPGRTQSRNRRPSRSIVQPYVDRGLMAGANGVVVNKNEVLNFPTAGYADLEAKKPMQRDTLFWIASTSKTFQATALMMLVDDGKVKLDDPVSKYLPDFKPRIAVKDAAGKETLREPAHAITVRMLLNHTSGLQYADPAVATRTDCCSLAAEVARFVSLPLMHEPGAKFAYQNAGPDTSSRIVEVVSGKDFETFLNERLLRPLGMKDTTYFPSEEQLSRLAVVYWFSPTEKKLVRAPQEVFLTLPYSDRKIRHAPGGGLFSTGGDLARFAQMYLGKRHARRPALSIRVRGRRDDPQPAFAGSFCHRAAATRRRARCARDIRAGLGSGCERRLFPSRRRIDRHSHRSGARLRGDLPAAAGA